MGNHTVRLLSETEEIRELLLDINISRPLCLHQQRYDHIVYDVYGSGKREIKEYAYLWFSDKEYGSKFECQKYPLTDQPCLFTNVRKSTIIRKYDNGSVDTSSNRTIGKYNGTLYDITGIIE